MPLTWAFQAKERATRIELAFSAWEADVLPLNYARGYHSLLEPEEYRRGPRQRPQRGTDPYGSSSGSGVCSDWPRGDRPDDCFDGRMKCFPRVSSCCWYFDPICAP